jgi:hypothetical protein
MNERKKERNELISRLPIDSDHNHSPFFFLLNLQTWIVKPAASACGRGIYLTTKYENMPQAGESHGGSKHAEFVVEEYIERPLLLRGFKFDLRIYVAVTSFSPLRIFLYDEGLVRSATEEYVAPADLRESLRQRNKVGARGGIGSHGAARGGSGGSSFVGGAGGGGVADDDEDEMEAAEALLLSHRFMHLTNYSVNKKNKAHFKPASVGGSNRNSDGTAAGGRKRSNIIDGMEVEIDDGCHGDDDHHEDDAMASSPSRGDGGGSGGSGGNDEQLNSKMTLAQLWEELLAMGVNVETVWQRIKGVVIKALLAVEPQVVSALDMHVPGRNCCFQVYGFDVLVDEKLKVWLLEVNFSPSMNTDSDLDLAVKGNMLADLFNLVGIPGLQQQQQQQQQQQRQQHIQHIQQQQLLAMTGDAFDDFSLFGGNGGGDDGGGKGGGAPSSPRANNRERHGLSGPSSVSHHPPLGRLESHVISDYLKEAARARQQEAMGPGRGFRCIFPLPSNAWDYQRFFLDGPRPANSCLAEFLSPKEGKYRHVMLAAVQAYQPQPGNSTNSPPNVTSSPTKLLSGAAFAAHRHRQRQQQVQVEMQTQMPPSAPSTSPIRRRPPPQQQQGRENSGGDWFALQRAKYHHHHHHHHQKQQQQQYGGGGAEEESVRLVSPPRLVSPSKQRRERGESSSSSSSSDALSPSHIVDDDGVEHVRQRVLRQRRQLREASASQVASPFLAATAEPPLLLHGGEEGIGDDARRAPRVRGRRCR